MALMSGVSIGPRSDIDLVRANDALVKDAEAALNIAEELEVLRKLKLLGYPGLLQKFANISQNNATGGIALPLNPLLLITVGFV